MPSRSAYNVACTRFARCGLSRMRLMCERTVTSATARENGIHVVTEAAPHTIPSLVYSILDYYNRKVRK